MNRKKRMVMILMLLITVTAIGCGKSHQQGEPDVVNTITTNYGEDYSEESIKVVANRDTIEDKAAFASKLVDMYKENSFQSVQFSTDRGYATSLHMKVYLWKDEIEGNKPFMTVDYSPIEGADHCDVVHNPDQYQLYIDGEPAEYQSSI
jgi:hypothetical protein